MKSRLGRDFLFVATEKRFMPKIKTNRGAAKRFRKTASGRFKRAHAFHNHILTKKDAKRKVGLRATTLVSEQDTPAIRRLLPYV